MPINIDAIDTEERTVARKDIKNGDGRSDLGYLHSLCAEARPNVEGIADALTRHHKLQSEISEKSDAAAVGKVMRPRIRKECPWFGLAHLRDFLRFRNFCNEIGDFEAVIAHFEQLQRDGHVRIVKIETAKMMAPTPFGWRCVATDLRMLGSGMLVEHYMSFSDLIFANERWLHKVYERWRSVDANDLLTTEAADLERDRTFSNHAFRQLAYDGILKCTPGAWLLAGARQRLDAQMTAELGLAFNPR